MNQLQDFLATLPVRAIPAGEVVLRQGDRKAHVLLLKSGSVEILKNEVQITEVSETGAVFGEMSILLDEPHTATVRTLEDSEFWVVENAKEFMNTHAAAGLYVAEILARRLDALNRYLVDVKSQFKGYDDHMNMVDEVLDSLMTKHPRKVERRPYTEP
jgi:CRP-like cAMP-binding protein